MTRVKDTIPAAAFVNLNLVRAMSGFTVVVSHFFQIFALPVDGRTPFRNFAVHSAVYAVLTFFVLSGFLISMSIQRNIRKNGRFDWPAYFVSRAARIYPALIASTLLCLVLFAALKVLGSGGPDALTRITDVQPPARSEFFFGKAEAVFTLLQIYAFGPGGYLNCNGPLWSLSYEVGFYLFAGLLMTLIQGRGASRPISVLLMVLVTAAACLSRRYLFLHYGTVWMLGVVLFLILDARGREKAGAVGARGLSRLALSILFIVLAAVNVALTALGFEGPLLHDFGASILIAIALYVVARFRRPLLAGVAGMADSTYTLYLFHFPILLFTYALIRDIHDRSVILYYATAAVATFSVIPLCHLLAKVLEKRRLWESLMEKLIRVVANAVYRKG